MSKRLVRRRVPRWLPFPLVLLLAAVLAPAASAQGVAISGRVLDAATGRPLVGARILVESLDRRTVTDSLGNFTVTQVEQGLYPVIVRHIGYAEQRADVIAAEGQEPTVIRLGTDPVMLEALRVEVNRFDRRRNSLPFRVQTLRRDEIVNTSVRDVRALLLQRFGLTPCGGSDKECVRIRGRNGRVVLYVDERPAPGGLSELELMDPNELYMAESYAGGAQIRVYTVTFMERATRTRMILEPIQL